MTQCLNVVTVALPRKSVAACATRISAAKRSSGFSLLKRRRGPRSVSSDGSRFNTGSSATFRTAFPLFSTAVAFASFRLVRSVRFRGSRREYVGGRGTGSLFVREKNDANQGKGRPPILFLLRVTFERRTCSSASKCRS